VDSRNSQYSLHIRRDVPNPPPCSPCSLWFKLLLLILNAKLETRNCLTGGWPTLSRYRIFESEKNAVAGCPILSNAKGGRESIPRKSKHCHRQGSARAGCCKSVSVSSVLSVVKAPAFDFERETRNCFSLREPRRPLAGGPPY
jgi:hypothetical protein